MIQTAAVSTGKGDNFPRLVGIMQDLLGPRGCPWDKKQTFETLRTFLIEEAFEVLEAIDRGDAEALREELGDLLLQVVFQAELARAQGWFGPNDVIDAVSDKLVRRHPWVFGDERVEDASGAIASWEQLKAEERKGGERGTLDGVPKAMPALLRAVRVGEKAASVGYDWTDAAGARRKVDEELAELDGAEAAGDRAAAEAELGDVLFALANFARKRGLDPEAALRSTLDRFSDRFGRAEQRARGQGRALRELSEAERDALWEQVKGEE